MNVPCQVASCMISFSLSLNSVRTKNKRMSETNVDNFCLLRVETREITSSKHSTDDEKHSYSISLFSCLPSFSYSSLPMAHFIFSGFGVVCGDDGKRFKTRSVRWDHNCISYCNYYDSVFYSALSVSLLVRNIYSPFLLSYLISWNGVHITYLPLFFCVYESVYVTSFPVCVI